MSQDTRWRPTVALTTARATVVFVIAAAGAGSGLHLLHAPGAPDRAATAPVPGTPVVAARLAPAGPAAIVQAYVSAINQRDYHRAWDLGGDHLGWSYGDVAAGYAGTARDILRVRSVRGDIVTAELTAVQPDGTRRAFRGTYTVANGTITGADIRDGS